jgi:hypothetical protein
MIVFCGGDIVNRRNFLVNFLLWILSFFFGYKVGSAHGSGLIIDKEESNEDSISVQMDNLSKEVSGIATDVNDRGINVNKFSHLVKKNTINPEDWDWADAFQAALDTGHNVYVPQGKYRIHKKELLITTQGQKLSGAGMGSSHGPSGLQNHQPTTELVFSGTGERYVKTRRLPRERASDPQDKPLSTAINIQNDGVQIEDLCIRLHCDYRNDSPKNLGDDWDVGIFIGTRAQIRRKNVRVLGYWRVAGIYYDVTRGMDLPEFTSPNGVTFPRGGIRSSVDQSFIENDYVRGGRKALFIAGPILTSSGKYYDQKLGKLIDDRRGRAGAADFHSLNSTYWAADHHSQRRMYDPVYPLDFEKENLDEIPASVVIDGVGAAVGEQIMRRLLFTNCRIRTFEAVRIGLGRVAELRFINLHTETGMDQVYDTKGKAINQEDLDYETGNNYGPIAVKKTTVDRNQWSIFINGINQRSPMQKWFKDVVPSYEITGQAHEARSEFNAVISKRVHSSNIYSNSIHVPNHSSNLFSIREANSDNMMLFTDSGVSVYRNFRGYHDNVFNLGSASQRWKQVFSADPVISTSNREEKAEIRDIPDKVLDAWSEVNFCQFKFKDAIEKKGNKARIHIGIIAQDIHKAFKNNGLNAFDYGLLCYDEWDDRYEDIEEVQITYTEDGEEIQSLVKTGEKKLVQKAGSRWSVRFDECQFLEMALMRREMKKLRSSR